jgi:hypothetical protein
MGCRLGQRRLWDRTGGGDFSLRHSIQLRDRPVPFVVSDFCRSRTIELANRGDRYRLPLVYPPAARCDFAVKLGGGRSSQPQKNREVTVNRREQTMNYIVQWPCHPIPVHFADTAPDEVVCDTVASQLAYVLQFADDEKHYREPYDKFWHQGPEGWYLDLDDVERDAQQKMETWGFNYSSPQEWADRNNRNNK